MPDLDADLELARDLARRAGALALAMQTGAREERKGDGSPVCRADRASDQLIVEALGEARADDAILSEERTATGAWQHSDRLWICDPIDGTRAYLDGRDEWAVQIALWAGGALRLGVVGLPARGRILSGMVGRGAWIEDADGCHPAILPPDPADALVLSRRLRHRLSAILPGQHLLFTSSVGGKVDHLLQGDAWGYCHPLPLSLWDAAAPAAVWLAAGGAVSDHTGRPLAGPSSGTRVPGLIMAAPARHPELHALCTGLYIDAFQA